MITIEEHVQQIVVANRNDEQALVYRIANEIQMLHAALPAPADLDAISYYLEMTGGQDVDLPDGTILDGPMFLRRAAQLVRLAISEQTELENEAATHA